MNESSRRGINEPEHVPESSYGIDPATGLFRHPPAAPYFPSPRPVKGSLDYFEEKEYIHNMTVEGRWPDLAIPGVTFQNFVDMNGRRYLFHYYRTDLNIYDITEPKNLKMVLKKKYAPGEGWFGAAAIAFNKKLNKWIMLQSFEVPRRRPAAGGLGGRKYSDPASVTEYMAQPGLRGFRVFELLGPTEWRQIAEVSTDPLHPKAKVQQGSGGLDIATYFGGKYAIVAAAPDNTFLRMEYPNYAYSPGQMIYDLEDPANPKLVNTWWVPGQRLGEETAYRAWRQFDNRTSWTGARMPMVVDKPLEAGGRYGYTAMGGLGFHVLDLSDPYDVKTLGSVDLPLNVGGLEGDFVDASRVQELGLVFVNGISQNEDGYEPYKDIYIIDVRDPTKPAIVGTLPRPRPPKDAPYSDFVLRRGKFGPKRAGYYCQPGKPRRDVAVYPFNSGGIQVFDIRDPLSATVTAYFVPSMTDTKKSANAYKNPMECIAIEWDRKLVWGFSNSGLYLLSSPALGTPNLGSPSR